MGVVKGYYGVVEMDYGVVKGYYGGGKGVLWEW